MKRQCFCVRKNHIRVSGKYHCLVRLLGFDFADHIFCFIHKYIGKTELFELLGAVMAFGLDDIRSRIAYEIGRSVGRYIYVLDAVDDYEDDLKQGKYNPLRGTGVAPESLSVAVRLELGRLEAAVNLLDFAGKPDLEGIIKNIIYLGMPKTADKVFSGKKERKV